MTPWVIHKLLKLPYNIGLMPPKYSLKERNEFSKLGAILTERQDNRKGGDTDLPVQDGRQDGDVDRHVDEDHVVSEEDDTQDGDG